MAMSKKRIAVLALAAVFAVLAILFASRSFRGAGAGRSSLLARYFTALEDADPVLLDELVADGFRSELPPLDLARGDWELYSFGDSPGAGGDGPGTQRFLLLAGDGSGRRRALLADMETAREGLVAVIAAIRLVDEGRSLAP